jgi:hypothetical protein
MLAFLALLFGDALAHSFGYRNIQTSRQNYPVMAKYDKYGVLRYCDGKRAGKPVGGKRSR